MTKIAEIAENEDDEGSGESDEFTGEEE